MLLLDGTAPIYVTAVSIGMLHGVEPGHGWPVAAVFALRQRNRWFYGFWAAVILAIAHLTSSFAVVAAYALANHFLDLRAFQWMHFVAGGLLLVMAVHQWRSAGHHHHRGHRHADHKMSRERLAGGTLFGLVGFAFALGFVHEEEFAIIALAAGKANPWLVMGVYAAAVSLSLIVLTSLAIATFNRFEKQLSHYHHHLPRVSAGILALMGLAYIFRLI
jgi:nickel/cobalt exporter